MNLVSAIRDNNIKFNLMKEKKVSKRRSLSNSDQSQDSNMRSKKKSKKKQKHRKEKSTRYKDKMKDHEQLKQEKERSSQLYYKKQHQFENQWQSSPKKYQQYKGEDSEKRQQNQMNQNKQQPNFEPSGILLQFYNQRQGVALKFNQPLQSHKPINEWRLYPFKDNNALKPIILKQSSYLIGKDQRICDILCENSSISRQHAVIQFRSSYKMTVENDYVLEVKPYIMDLQSTNGTILNQQKIQPSKYYELLDKDTLKFGLSDREYVMFQVPKQQNA